MQVRKRREALIEAEELATAVDQRLKEQPVEVPGRWMWSDLALRREQMETAVDVLKLCLTIQRDADPETAHHVKRRWRRGVGLREDGWIEVRSVRGHSPYV
ncbi:hypothetical protein [Ktedonospora formicarum]|uniref:Uncharacterized protein n=1 Tax=Ktedonospora formicarum TaxID=2778364 RepID=A0A8J3I1Z4_9CHLR|nr:hypothetical protein [Ktedonospora formicarum]GHO47301.1 hypothetical protein KSX_54640 [Ktedonospora formicarum]